MDQLEWSTQSGEQLRLRSSDSTREELLQLFQDDEQHYPRQLTLASLWRDIHRQGALRDFFSVGPDKPVALYGQREIETVDREGVSAIQQYVEDMNHRPDVAYTLSLLGIPASENTWRYRADKLSAAVWYLYADEIVQGYLDQYQDILEQYQRPTDSKSFIRYLARHKITDDKPELLRMIHILFDLQK